MHRWRSHRHAQLATHVWWRRGETRGVVARRRGVLLLGLHGRRRGRLLDDGGEGFGRDEAHEEEGLEDGVGELGRLVQEVGGARGVGRGEGFHLREDVEELCWRERVERA